MIRHRFLTGTQSIDRPNHHQEYTQEHSIVESNRANENQPAGLMNHHHQSRILAFQAVSHFYQICQVQGHIPTILYDEPFPQRFRARLYVASHEIFHPTVDEFFLSKKAAKEAICLRGIERLNSLFPSSSSTPTTDGDGGGSVNGGGGGGGGGGENWIGKLMGKSNTLYPLGFSISIGS